MNLTQVLLPIYLNSGKRVSQPLFSKTRAELIEKFGGLTAYPSAAKGFWKTGGHTDHDDIILFEVMVTRPNTHWWKQYRRRLERRFKQEKIVVRSLSFRIL